MSGYRVETDVLADVDAALAESARHAHTELLTLRRHAEELLDGWHGIGGAAFAQGWHDWHAGTRDLLIALADLAAAVGVSGQGYAATEDAVRASLVSS